MPLYPEHDDHHDTISRVDAVLRGLTPEERSVALAWARTGDSWEDAAADAGLPASHGERVRRKLKRLGAQHTQRTAAATDTRQERR